MGAAPFPLFVRRLREARCGEVRILLGARTAQGLYALDRLTPEHPLTITEDGSQPGGRKGMVTDLLEEALGEMGSQAAVYACGPEPMLEAVVRMCVAAGVPCRVSLEAMMACGTGLCNGCAVRLAGDGYARVCRDGPVFEAERLAVPWTR